MKAEVRPMPYGFMCWWDAVEDAANYQVSLLIEYKNRRTGEKEYKRISQIVKDRKTLYHSFTNLANPYSSNASYSMRYYVSVEAEDREGNIVEKAEPIEAKIETTYNVYDGSNVCVI